jgi:hypothetical protein
MKKEQALAIIKQVLDESLKKGVIPNLETVQQILQALSVLANSNGETNG